MQDKELGVEECKIKDWEKERNGSSYSIGTAARLKGIQIDATIKEHIAKHCATFNQFKRL
ncbi:hypothetical protein E2C01_011916 [Portunus trituberculatus]|uniref:Uncharacterized protein n=1 Tax=Portunus trituberculatus TaxID=210409 RepID=A0A5B7DCI8_PORTR|nr:hypothetical protein [Portunus trituberculatus]